MNRSEYRNYLKRLDGATQRWKVQIQAFDIATLKTSYESGKQLEHARGALGQNIQLIRGFIEGQLLNESLSSDILAQNSIADAVDVAQGLVWLLPGNDQGEHWQRVFGDMAKEMTEFDLKMREHVVAYADQLQASAAKCSK